MLKHKSLEEIIRENIPLGRQDNNGWYTLRCCVCNDHSPRAGFKFDGDTVVFNDFNCSAKFKHTEGNPLSRTAKKILESFGIDRSKLESLSSSLFMAKREPENITLEDLTKPKIFTPEVALPEGSIPLLSREHEDLQEPLIEYLLNRKIDPSLVPLYFSTNQKMSGRIIIPYYRNGKIIYWQARHIDPSVKPRYLNCSVSKDAVIYGYDRLYAYDTAPLFVTEGVFNAVLLNGIAVMAATLNKSKIEILKQTKRRLIFVRDRDANGSHLSGQALENGWEITTVDSRVNDVNDSVKRFGVIYTIYSLMNNIQNPTTDKNASTINLNLWSLEDRLKNRKPVLSKQNPKSVLFQ